MKLASCALLALLVVCAPQKPSVDFDKLDEPTQRLAANTI